MRASRKGRSDAGSSTALTLMLGVGFIVLPVMVVVLTVPTWEQRAVDAQDTARGAARALVMADDWGDGVTAADEVVAQVIENDALPPGDVTVQYSGSLSPGASVTASVTITVPVGELPGLGFVGTLHYTATSTDDVGSYRGSPGMGPTA
jgi:hypothetical protein